MKQRVGKIHRQLEAFFTQKVRNCVILGSPLGLEMLIFWTKGGENRKLFADMVPGRPRVPRKTSQSEVLGAFWAHILYVFVSIQCHISKIFQRFARVVFACLLFMCFIICLKILSKM